MVQSEMDILTLAYKVDTDTMSLLYTGHSDLVDFCKHWPLIQISWQPVLRFRFRFYHSPCFEMTVILPSNSRFHNTAIVSFWVSILLKLISHDLPPFNNELTTSILW